MCKKKLMAPRDSEKKEQLLRTNKPAVSSEGRQGEDESGSVPEATELPKKLQQGHLWRRTNPRPAWIYVQKVCKVVRCHPGTKERYSATSNKQIGTKGEGKYFPGLYYTFFPLLLRVSKPPAHPLGWGWVIQTFVQRPQASRCPTNIHPRTEQDLVLQGDAGQLGEHQKGASLSHRESRGSHWQWGALGRAQGRDRYLGPSSSSLRHTKSPNFS